MSTPVLTFTPRGIYCPAGDFYIDPWRRVDRALITHGHADHARRGHGAYLATASAAPVIEMRLGRIAMDRVAYGETRRIGDASVSFHPAGHVPGSAQIRVEVGGEIWVVSGDYKTEDCGLSEPFQPVPCHSFISECTFGLPAFRWQPQSLVLGEINAWWARMVADGITPVIGAYSLGKAQRLLANLDLSTGPVLTHPAIHATNEILRAQGFALPQTVRLTPELRRADYPGALILSPTTGPEAQVLQGFRPYRAAFVSGWMRLRSARRQRSVSTGFVLSDHADWDGLNAAIRATGAERIFVTHGYTAPFRRWLAEQGYDAQIVQTRFGDETVEGAEP